MQKTRTIEQLKAAILKKGYKWFDRGDYNLNFIGVRESDIFTDTFTDTLYLVYKVKGEWVMKSFIWTTKPGAFGVYNPPTIAGITGVACLKEGQYQSVYKFIDSPNNRWEAPYLMQVGNLTIYRDADKDNKLTRKVEQTGDWFGIFCHQMGIGNRIYNWSLGCQGSPKKVWVNEIVPIFRACAKVWGNTLTYTLLNEKDL